MGDENSANNFPMLDLFKIEVNEQGKILTERLLKLEEDPSSAESLETLMRAAHSLKGAARLVGIEPVVSLAHLMEDLFVAAQNSELTLTAGSVDIILSGMDMISSIAELSGNEIAEWDSSHKKEFDNLVEKIGSIRHGRPEPGKAPVTPDTVEEDFPKKKTENPAVKKSQTVDSPLMDLFRIEAGEQGKILTEGLLKLEEDPTSAENLEALMRAAHSLKGAARMVGVKSVVSLAHQMEDLFVAAQNSELALTADHMDLLLEIVDTIRSISDLSDQEMLAWGEDNRGDFDHMIDSLSRINSHEEPGSPEMTDNTDTPDTEPEKNKNLVEHIQKPKTTASDNPDNNNNDKDRVLRVTAQRWNHVMGLAGEVKVEAGWLYPYIESQAHLKRMQVELIEILDALRSRLDDMQIDKSIVDLLLAAHKKASDCRTFLADQTNDLDSSNRRMSSLSDKLYRETIKTRMRPFSDGVHGFQRMVRDIARSLGKKVKLEIIGLSTQVGRDVLEKMEAPLNHILRNALDHGVETPEERIKAGKPEQATIKVTAANSHGMLSIIIEDDGRGIDLEHLRQKVIEKGQVTPEMATRLSEEELIDFLFLPSFSTKDEVTDISGRGVGLDVVLDTIKKMRGSVTTTTKLGKGTRFHVQLPLLLAVLPSLIVEIAGEPYAFPLARIIHTVMLPCHDMNVLEDHQFAEIDGKNIGLVGASQVFGFGPQVVNGEEMPVVIIGDHKNSFGVVVDRFVELKELAVQRLDPRLGKVQDISSAALLEDGSPILIVDVDDLVFSVDALMKGGRIGKVMRSTGDDAEEVFKKILVVDDSLTVREVERSLLEKAGYHVDLAVDGKDGWNAIRTFKKYDLVITDIDMPRMDGIELVRMIKGDRNFSSLPVVIVSYKERAEDRKRGMDAGADYYLTKGSFHDNSLLEAVADLIEEGKP